jgi:hypothetical protein
VVHDTSSPRVSTVPPLSATDRLALAWLTGVHMLAAVGALVTLPARGDAATRPQARVAAASQVAEPVAAPVAGGLPKVKDGRVLTHFTDAGFLGVVMDAGRRNVLHVVVARGSRAVDCNLLEPAVHITEQSVTAVRLVVSGYQYVPRASSGTGGTTCVTAGSTSVPVTLAAPLGTRRVYQGGNAESTTVADPADLPAPGSLPVGYREHSTSPVAPGVDTLVGERSYARGSDRIVVRVGSRYDVLAEGDQSSDTTVDGHYAVVTDSGSGRCVTWTELSGRVRQVCSSGAAPLATPQLLTVARSLR